MRGRKQPGSRVKPTAKQNPKQSGKKMTIYIYSNETGQQVDCYTGKDNADCNAWAEKAYGSNDCHWSYTDSDASNAVPNDQPEAPFTVYANEYQDCGHNHRTIDAACKCRKKLIGYNPKTRTCSAKWYNAQILDRNGRRVETAN